MYKSKYSLVFKRRLAQLYLDEMSAVEVGKKFNVSTGQIKYWGAILKIHGESAFVRRTDNPSTDFKFSVLESMRQNKWSINYTSAVFQLSSPGILSKWLSDYCAQGIVGLKPKKKGRSMKYSPPAINSKPSKDMSEKELQDEIEYLRAENAVLKKLEALAQQKRKQAKKKR